LINFISSLPRELRSGGFSAMNTGALAAMSRLDAVHYVGPVNPPIILWQKILSKLLRVSGARGNFFFYSSQRLQTIADEVREASADEAQMDFFHGFTPWIMTMPKRPYAAWCDCTFRDYISVFHRRESFRERDLQRIEQTEAGWLKGARRVLFTSQWAASRAVSDYRLDARRVASVGIFGEIDPPEHDAYDGGTEFAFISTNFQDKGGPIVLAAFQKLKRRYPDSSLIVLGDKPVEGVPVPGVEFTGFLRKEVPDEHARFRQILGRLRALVHPTRSDISPLLLIEAGYFGCPVISSRMFAIPELVDDMRSGILLDNPCSIDSVADAMSWMIENEDHYRQMRRAAWTTSRERHSRARFENRMMACVREAAEGTFVS
jgi:glycosyltransferase involved in cell wall biosynthesis